MTKLNKDIETMSVEDLVNLLHNEYNVLLHATTTTTLRVFGELIDITLTDINIRSVLLGLAIGCSLHHTKED
jgi:hypothetical protein